MVAAPLIAPSAMLRWPGAVDGLAVISGLGGVLAWRNGVERRVSGRVRGVTGACQGRCR
jgi:hypothetical protein